MYPQLFKNGTLNEVLLSQHERAQARANRRASFRAWARAKARERAAGPPPSFQQGPISAPLLEPAPAPVPGTAPVPVPDQGLAPVPVPDQVPAPAPLPEVAPAPIPEHGPIPYPEALVALLQNQVPQVPFNPERLAQLVAPFTHFKRVTVGDTNGGVLELPAKLARDLSSHININILRVISGGRVELQNNVPQFWVWARSHNSVVNRRMAFVNNYQRSSLSTASWREIREGVPPSLGCGSGGPWIVLRRTLMPQAGAGSRCQPLRGSTLSPTSSTIISSQMLRFLSRRTNSPLLSSRLFVIFTRFMPTAIYSCGRITRKLGDADNPEVSEFLKTAVCCLMDSIMLPASGKKPNFDPLISALLNPIIQMHEQVAEAHKSKGISNSSPRNRFGLDLGQISKSSVDVPLSNNISASASYRNSKTSSKIFLINCLCVIQHPLLGHMVAAKYVKKLGLKIENHAGILVGK
ncbi:Conserved oligomeric Golgi complex subunit [Trema orientale]|uniref:Conserved oligomeric Golgi complex subunit n=1 Tax=Trema orientale TaxID=63057 RepID=A0A2P5FCU9_TREOI|nr:Conserved oligomeric Golgi complex subunit [Trema orientale]